MKQMFREYKISFKTCSVPYFVGRKITWKVREGKGPTDHIRNNLNCLGGKTDKISVHVVPNM